MKICIFHPLLTNYLHLLINVLILFLDTMQRNQEFVKKRAKELAGLLERVVHQLVLEQNLELAPINEAVSNVYIEVADGGQNEKCIAFYIRCATVFTELIFKHFQSFLKNIYLPIKYVPYRIVSMSDGSGTDILAFSSALKAYKVNPMDVSITFACNSSMLAQLFDKTFALMYDDENAARLSSMTSTRHFHYTFIQYDSATGLISEELELELKRADLVTMHSPFEYSYSPIPAKNRVEVSHNDNTSVLLFFCYCFKYLCRLFFFCAITQLMNF